MLTDKEDLFLHHIWGYKPAYRLKWWLENATWFGLDIGWDLTEDSYNQIKQNMIKLGYLTSRGALSKLGKSYIALKTTKGTSAIQHMLWDVRNKCAFIFQKAQGSV